MDHSRSRGNLSLDSFLEAVIGKPSPASTAAFVAVIRGERDLDREPELLAEILGEANFDPDEPRDEKGRWTTGGTSWSDGLAELTGRIGDDDKISRGSRRTSVKRGPSNEFFPQQTWTYGEGKNAKHVEFRVVKRDTVVVYLTHWKPPKPQQMGGKYAPMVGDPGDGPAAGRVGYLSCWGNDYNKGPSTIKGFPEKMNGLIGDGKILGADRQLGEKYGKDTSDEAANNHYKLGEQQFRRLLTDA